MKHKNLYGLVGENLNSLRVFVHCNFLKKKSLDYSFAEEKLNNKCFFTFLLQMSCDKEKKC